MIPPDLDVARKLRLIQPSLQQITSRPKLCKHNVLEKLVPLLALGEGGGGDVSSVLADVHRYHRLGLVSASRSILAWISLRQLQLLRL